MGRAMDRKTRDKLREWAETYNDRTYFREDPIVFPTRFAELLRRGEACLQDVEVAAVVAGHLAWGRRCMIVRDTVRAMDEMDWHPYDYVMRGKYRDDATSLHRTVKWSEMAGILGRLREHYLGSGTLEDMDTERMRCVLFGSKPDPKAPNKKINMIRRWMVRDDGKVDLGLWKNSSKDELVIPLDVHVYNVASELGLTVRKQKDLRTAMEITDAFRDIFPGDPCKGDFALFGYGVTHSE